MSLPPIPFSQKAGRTSEQPVSRLMAETLSNPSLISLAVGFVDQASLPASDMGGVFRDLMEDSSAGQAALQYGTTRGYPKLRELLLRHLEHLERKARSGMKLGVDQVLVTTGSQQGLYLLADVLLDPGDIVIASAPSYFVFTNALSSFGADVRTVEMDEGGMRIDRLEALLADLETSEALSRVKAIYVMSYFQNPTGINLTRDRRERLLDLARTYSRAHRILVIEDAAYRELCYDGSALPSIKSHDEDNEYVALAMSFSKSFSPGLKAGYLFLPDALVEAVVAQKGNHDFGTANLIQHALTRAMESGLYEEHVSRLRDMYRVKRDAMLEVLGEELADTGATWTKPGGGLYVWVTLPEGIDTRRGGDLFRRCIDLGVMYVPGDYCFVPQAGGAAPTNHMRLSFGGVDVPAIQEGVRRLGKAVRRQVRPRAGLANVTGGAA